MGLFQGILVLYCLCVLMSLNPDVLVSQCPCEIVPEISKVSVSVSIVKICNNYEQSILVNLEIPHIIGPLHCTRFPETGMFSVQELRPQLGHKL